MWKSLRYYWRTNLAVLCAIAVTTAVLTGALLVGDSVKGSLRALTLDRLGQINYAMISDHFVRQELASETNSAPAILLTGGASALKKRASGINITAVDSTGLKLFGSAELESSLSKSGIYPPVIINQALAKELGVQVGDEILLSFSKPTDIERETILGNRDATEVTQRSRFLISAILPNSGIGLFTLNTNQHSPLNAYVLLSRFQRILNQPQRINSILSSSTNKPEMRGHLRMEDLTLKIQDLAGELTGGIFALESDEVVLKPAAVKLAEEVADSMNLKHFRVLTYLANRITLGDHVLPYSTITAVTPSVPFSTTDQTSISKIDDEEILLNEWAATDLGVKPGDTLTVSYFVLGPDNKLITRQSTFKLKAVILQKDLAADPSLTPEYPGIQNAQHISDWSPPFPVDLSLIRPKDEDYWNEYRATPKGFVSENTGKKLWSSRFGTFTSIRFLGGSKEQFQAELLNRIQPSEWNMEFRPVKEEGLRASEGATDFAGLFIGFSLFLIIAAALLVTLLFRLGIEQRTKEIGLLLASGYQTRQVQKTLVSEGVVLTSIGAALGLLLAQTYAAWVIHGLQSRWIDAIGSSFLNFYANKLSLIIGFSSAALLCLLVIAWSVLKLSKRSTLTLLKGDTNVLETKSTGWNRIIFLTALLLAVGLTSAAFFIESPVLFFAAGAACLLALIALFSVWLRAPKSFLRPEHGAAWKLSIRNAVRNPSRSMFSVCLVACACFVIISVGANRQDRIENLLDKQSGTGGFSLVATTDIPIYEPLDLPEASAPLEMFAFRLLPGDDASCLNLYQPQKPRILGVPDAFVESGGFRFQKSIQKIENPWKLLKEPMSGVVAAIGDYNSVRWILHKNLGDEISMADENGGMVRLKIVGLLEGSLLQSELLISEENFLKHFPNHGGKSYFLIQTDLEHRNSISTFLESELSAYGFDAMNTEEKLAAYHAVENTYLSTFQTLGALGLLLGTLGLGIILIRNVLERRSELAILRAFGFQRKKLTVLVLMESAFLLIVGIISGSVSAVIAVLPHLQSQSPDVPVASLSLTLFIVFGVGMMSSVAAVFAVLRIPLLPALKEL